MVLTNFPNHVHVGIKLFSQLTYHSYLIDLYRQNYHQPSLFTYQFHAIRKYYLISNLDKLFLTKVLQFSHLIHQFNHLVH